LVLDKNKVESRITSKGFKPDDSHHRFFVYYNLQGQKTSIKTKTSHSSDNDLKDFHIKAMSAQCKLDKKEFIAFVECTLNQAEYENHLRTNNFIK
jgi:hypothetical protein